MKRRLSGYSGSHLYTEVYKCASTSLSRFFIEQGWSRFDLCSVRPVEAEGFVVVREPFSRYVSGVLWYWHVVHGLDRRIPGFINDLHEFLQNEIKEGPRVVDHHTEPQWWSHAWADKVFSLDDRLGDRLTDYLQIPVALGKWNASDSVEADTFVEMLGDVGRQKVLEFYDRDLEIFNLSSVIDR